MDANDLKSSREATNAFKNRLEKSEQFKLSKLFANASEIVQEMIIGIVLGSGLAIAGGIGVYGVVKGMSSYMEYQVKEQAREVASYDKQEIQNFLKSREYQDVLTGTNKIAWDNNTLDNLKGKTQELTAIKSPFEKNKYIYFAFLDEIQLNPDHHYKEIFGEKIFKGVESNAYHIIQGKESELFEEVKANSYILLDKNVAIENDFFKSENHDLYYAFVILHELSHDTFIQNINKKLLSSNVVKQTNESHSDALAMMMLQKTYNLSDKETIHNIDGLIEYRKKEAVRTTRNNHNTVNTLENLKNIYLEGGGSFINKLSNEMLAFFANDLSINAGHTPWQNYLDKSLAEKVSALDSSLVDIKGDLPLFLSINESLLIYSDALIKSSADAKIANIYSKLTIWDAYEKELEEIESLDETESSLLYSSLKEKVIQSYGSLTKDIESKEELIEERNRIVKTLKSKILVDEIEYEIPEEMKLKGRESLSLKEKLISKYKI